MRICVCEFIVGFIHLLYFVIVFLGPVRSHQYFPWASRCSHLVPSDSAVSHLLVSRRSFVPSVSTQLWIVVILHVRSRSPPWLLQLFVFRVVLLVLFCHLRWSVWIPGPWKQPDMLWVCCFASCRSWLLHNMWLYKGWETQRHITRSEFTGDQQGGPWETTYSSLTHSQVWILVKTNYRCFKC